MSEGISPALQPITLDARLPFDIPFQEAAIGHLIKDDFFLRRSRNIITTRWFGDGVLGMIWDALVAFHSHFDRCPTVAELKSEFGGLTDFVKKEEILKKIDVCLYMTQEYGFDLVKSRCTLWLQSQLIKEAAGNLDRHYMQGHIPRALQYVQEKFPEIVQANFEPDTRETFDNTRRDILDNYVQNCANACTTGCQRFDRAILRSDNPADGGLMVGDMTVVMAPVSKGKTSFLITVAIQNIMRGKDVLLLVHEDVLNIKRRVMMCALKCPANELVAKYQTPQGFEEILEWERRLQKHLVYLPLDRPGGTYVEDVVTTVMEQQKEWKRLHNGKGFDLLVDDFPAKLLTRNRKKDEFRNQMYFIYAQFASLAASERFHVLTAVQSNRDGAKANLDGARALGMEDTAEAFGIPQIAHNFITINRSDTDRAEKIVRFHLAKCRGEDTGRIIVCKSRFDFYQTHGDDLGEGSCMVESGWVKAAKETAVGGISPTGDENAKKSEGMTSHGKLVAKQEIANRGPEEIRKFKEEQRAEKERLENENAASCTVEPDDGDPGPSGSVG